MPKIFDEVKKQGRKILTEIEAKAVIGDAGIPVVTTYLARTRKEAQQFSARLGFPVVLKVCSADIIHKTEAGGVSLNLTSAEEVARAYDQMLETAATRHPGANIAGVSVQKMIRGGVEVIAGMTRDPQFGPMIMFGLGGIFVEILKDVSFRIVPLTEEDAYEMLSELRGGPFGRGKGSRPVKEALVDILIKLSRFIEGNPEIKELDINPILADDQGAVAVDARIILE